MQRHRNQKPIPTDPDERRERIRWLLAHKVWTHPAKIRMPPEGNLRAPYKKWVETDVDDGSIHDCWWVDVVYVNPETETIEDDRSLNTAFRVWIEAGPWYDLSQNENEIVPPGGWNEYNKWTRSHDHYLDCGAPTMEEALLRLASLVEVFYQDDGKSRGITWCGFDDKKCEADEEGFCVNCGLNVRED